MKRGLALALSALAVVGCKDKERADKRRAVGQVSDRSGSSPPPIGITGIAVETVEPKRPREIYERQLAKSLAALLDRSPHFVANPGDRDDVLRARITARIQYDVIAKNDEGHVLAAVELEVAWQAIESASTCARAGAGRAQDRRR